MSKHPQTGSLHVIYGPMFAGKTGVLGKSIKRLGIVFPNAALINHALDTRTESNTIRTHDGDIWPAIHCQLLKDFIESADYKSVQVVGIDEGQFFPDLVDSVMQMVNDRKHIVVAGLSGNHRNEPFGQMMELIPRADTTEHLYAVCKKCGDNTPAPFTKRLCRQDEEICVGASDMYESVCRFHFNQ